MLGMILLTACAAEPTYVVVNKAGARYVVVNRVPAEGRGCKTCGNYCDCFSNIPNGTCGECKGVRLDTLTPANLAAPATGALTTASGRVIRATATGYVYADEDAPAQVLDCSSGKCRWVDTPNSRPAYLPSVTPASYAPAASSCPGGNCPTGFRPAPRFAFPTK